LPEIEDISKSVIYALIPPNELLNLSEISRVSEGLISDSWKVCVPADLPVDSSLPVDPTAWKVCVPVDMETLT
jgi:hypothetical protein